MADVLERDLGTVLEWLAVAPADPTVEAIARALLLDTLGCAIAGAAEPEVAALAIQLAAADPGALRFPGLTVGLTSAGLAQWFAAAACWHEACEGLASAHGRPGLHALPAILGPALTRRTTLGAVLDALISGYEVGGRLGAICRIRPGMHVDGTWGSFAAAASYARLIGVDPATTLAALNHVACHMPFSLYHPITFGSTARNAYAGHGATHGVAAVAASLAGLGGPPGSIAAMTAIALGTAEAALPAAAPPGHWLIRDGYLKYYPAVKHVHFGVAAAEAFHAEAPFPAAEIDVLSLDIYAEARTYCANRAPNTAIQAQFSLSYGLSWSLLYGRLVPLAYTSAHLSDPKVARLERMLAIETDTALTATGARGCTLHVGAGTRSWSLRIDTVPGDPNRPMTRAELVAKFTAFAAPVIGTPASAAIVAYVLDGQRNAVFDLAA